MTVASRIAVMERGRIAQIGAANEVYERPASRSVAEFIGDINLLDGRVESIQHAIASVEIAGIGTLKVRAENTVAEGAEVTVAVRPEKLRLSRKEPADGFLNPIHGTVSDIGYRGDFSVYKIACGDGRVMKASMPNPMRSMIHPFRRGDEVWISWTTDAALLLTQ
jgi:putrescine transport system ATP-binding protein